LDAGASSAQTASNKRYLEAFREHDVKMRRAGTARIAAEERRG
jgi:hypothetical protein